MAKKDFLTLYISNQLFLIIISWVIKGELKQRQYITKTKKTTIRRKTKWHWKLLDERKETKYIKNNRHFVHKLRKWFDINT